MYSSNSKAILNFYSFFYWICWKVSSTAEYPFLHSHFPLSLKHLTFELYMKSLFFLWIYWLLTPCRQLNVVHICTCFGLLLFFLLSHCQSHSSQLPNKGEVLKGLEQEDIMICFYFYSTCVCWEHTVCQALF